MDNKSKIKMVHMFLVSLVLVSTFTSTCLGLQQDQRIKVLEEENIEELHMNPSNVKTEDDSDNVAEDKDKKGRSEELSDDRGLVVTACVIVVIFVIAVYYSQYS